jgi:hypothetical protein
MSSPSTSVERSMIWSLAEGGTHTIGGFTHRSARKFILLDQDDIDDARLGEVVRDAGADHAAAKEHDRRAREDPCSCPCPLPLRSRVVRLYADARNSSCQDTWFGNHGGSGFGLRTAVPTTPKRAVPTCRRVSTPKSHNQQQFSSPEQGSHPHRRQRRIRDSSDENGVVAHG